MERYRDAVPFYPQQGKFASAYYKLGLEQNIDCKNCHLGDDPVILTAEQLCVKCLISKAELVSVDLKRNEDLLKERRFLDSELLKINSHQKASYKYRSCVLEPDCPDGLNCIFLHKSDNPLLNTIMQTTLNPQSIAGSVASNVPPAHPIDFAGGLFLRISYPAWFFFEIYLFRTNMLLLIVVVIFGSHYYLIASLQVHHNCIQCYANQLNLRQMILPNDMCVRCLLNFAKWADMLNIQNDHLRNQNSNLQKMLTALKGYKSKNYRTRKCQIKDCADLQCPFAHADRDVRPVSLQDFDVGHIDQLFD